LVGTYTERKRRATAFGIFNTIGLLGSVSASLILGLAADASPIGMLESGLLGSASSSLIQGVSTESSLVGIQVMFYIVIGFSIAVFLMSILLMFLFRKNQKKERDLVMDKD